MKKTITKILSLMLSLTMIITALPLLGMTANAEEAHNYSAGDIVEFGSYPQSEVTDEALIGELNSQTLEWISYDYYIGTGEINDGQTQSDYMKYADVTYNGNKYRAVTFSQYRPCVTVYTSAETYQDDNGYYTDTVYWFEYEPLEWRVLDPDEGLIMCESVIDSQAYNNTIYDENTEWYQDSSCEKYANDYASSSIREWLNDDFYNTAFTNEEKNEIQQSTLDNRCPVDSKYDSETTYDKVFLLSYNEALNENYGFSAYSYKRDLARVAGGTDYAKCQGVSVGANSYNEKCYWWLRSADIYSGACFIIDTGDFNPEAFAPCWTCIGVRPVIRVNPEYALHMQEINFTLNIQEPSRTEIRYYDGIVLHAVVEGNTPAGAYLEWSSDNYNFAKIPYGDSLEIIAIEKGYTTFTVTLYDLDGNAIATESIEMYSKSGLFQKILGFFRNLLGLTTIYRY